MLILIFYSYAVLASHYPSIHIHRVHFLHIRSSHGNTTFYVVLFSPCVSKDMQCDILQLKDNITYVITSEFLHPVGHECCRLEVNGCESPGLLCVSRAILLVKVYISVCFLFSSIHRFTESLIPPIHVNSLIKDEAT